VAWGIQSGGVSSSIGFNLSLYLESRTTPGISDSSEYMQRMSTRNILWNKLTILILTLSSLDESVDVIISDDRCAQWC
jgi:hypothetical protein